MDKIYDDLVKLLRGQQSMDTHEKNDTSIYYDLEIIKLTSIDLAKRIAAIQEKINKNGI